MIKKKKVKQSTVEYYSALKKNERPSPEMTWGDIKWNYSMKEDNKKGYVFSDPTV